MNFSKTFSSSAIELWSDLLVRGFGGLKAFSVLAKKKITFRVFAPRGCKTPRAISIALYGLFSLISFHFRTQNSLIAEDPAQQPGVWKGLWLSYQKWNFDTLLTSWFPMCQIGAFQPLRRDYAKLRYRGMSWIASKGRAALFLSYIEAEVSVKSHELSEFQNVCAMIFTKF